MADVEDKVHFYEQIQSVIDKVPARDMKILMGDLNAKVATDNTNRDLIMGRQGTGEQNENGELFAEFCTFNDLVIGGTLFPHRPSIRPRGLPLTARQRIRLTTLPSAESGEGACATSG